MAMLAYAARYGHQPLSELRALSLDELKTFCRALNDIVDAENTPAEERDDL